MMMKQTILAITGIALANVTNAQTSDDRKIIDKLCGCFEVEFKYAETFSPQKDYKFHDREIINGGVELVLPIEISDKKVVMQHLLVITDDIIVKHWREEWTYENPVQWEYRGDHVWQKKNLGNETVKDKWTQSVWEVSDAPRYQGHSRFVNLDNKLIWQSTTDAPLPRREYTVRNDYNILKRTNRLNITDSGYVHEQDNQKIIRKNGTDQLLAEEKGINSYRRIADSKCDPARKYWEQYKGYWPKVRLVWEQYLAAQDRIELYTIVDGRPLHDYLYELGKEYVNGKIKEGEIDTRIGTIVKKFMKGKGIASTQ